MRFAAWRKDEGHASLAARPEPQALSGMTFAREHLSCCYHSAARSAEQRPQSAIGCPTRAVAEDGLTDNLADAAFHAARVSRKASCFGVCERVELKLRLRSIEVHHRRHRETRREHRDLLSVPPLCFSVSLCVLKNNPFATFPESLHYSRFTNEKRPESKGEFRSLFQRRENVKFSAFHQRRARRMEAASTIDLSGTSPEKLWSKRRSMM